jgi:hypothetical protein
VGVALDVLLLLLLVVVLLLVLLVGAAALSSLGHVLSCVRGLRVMLVA